MRFIRYTISVALLICCVLGQTDKKKNLRQTSLQFSDTDDGRNIGTLTDPDEGTHGHTGGKRRRLKGNKGGYYGKGKGGYYHTKGNKGYGSNHYYGGKGKGGHYKPHGKGKGHYYRPYWYPASPPSYAPPPTKPPTGNIFHRAWFFPSPPRTPDPPTPPPPTPPLTPPPTPPPTPSPTLPPVPGPTPPLTPPPTPTPTSGPAPTSSPTCLQNDLDVCIAIDRSGSICTPPGEPFISCAGNPDCGCDNFDLVRAFTQGVIEGVGELSATMWAIIGFATTARVETSLVGVEEALVAVEEFPYTSGWTATGPAIELCREELDNDSGNEKTIILLTDGTPTRPDTEDAGSPWTEARNYATEQANLAKGEDDITLITVFVNTATSTSDFLESLSSPGFFLEVTNFDDLDEVTDSLLSLVQCS